MSQRPSISGRAAVPDYPTLTKPSAVKDALLLPESQNLGHLSFDATCASPTGPRAFEQGDTMTLTARPEGRAMNQISLEPCNNDRPSGGNDLLLKLQNSDDPDVQKILDYIRNHGHDTDKVILDAMEEILKHAIKAHEQNVQYVKDVIVPREQAAKKDLLQEKVQIELAQKQALQQLLASKLML